MDNNVVQFIGSSCGQHGPYTFYKAFKYKKNGVNRIVTLGEFFFVKLWIDSDLLCIGELQLLWIDKNSEQVLASLRLYFLPENTPEGRMDHGEDEVLAISEKVVLRVEDLVTWITVDAEWTWGRLGRCNKQVKEPPDGEKDDVGPVSLSESSLDFSDVDKEKRVLDNEEKSHGPCVVILSYPKYCRYRATMKRLEGVEDEFLKYRIVEALGGFSFSSQNTRVMFCKDTFDYPDLEGHELLCNHLAPKLKGRPRGKRKKRSLSPGSESNESECSVVTSITAKSKSSIDNNKNGYCLEGVAPRRSTRSSDNSDTKEFLKKLNMFMKMKKTPLGRTPCLGTKEIDLHDLYTKVQKMGGYDSVTTNRLWKNVTDELNGRTNSGTSTIIKRHYERCLLPYERHIRGEEYKPLPVSERRRLKSKSANNSSKSENFNQLDQKYPISSTSVDKSSLPKLATQDMKETNGNVKLEPKISSLRSVRVKPERQKDKFAKVVKMEEVNSDKEGLESIKGENRASTEITTIVIDEDKQDEKDVIKLKDSTGDETSTDNINFERKTEKERDKEREFGDNIRKKKETLIINVPSSPSDENNIKKTSLKYLKQEVLEKRVEKTSFIDELRKDKLAILQEGGLEVTPVHPVVNNNESREVFVPLAKNLKNDKQQISTHSPVERLPITIPQSLNISKVSVPSTNKLGTVFPYPEKTNSTTPPKVVQSRSIYSYSEKTVYGNPKDYLVNNKYVAQTPKAPMNYTRPTGGDLLDLTVASPQKPIFDNRVPSGTSSYHFNTPKNVVKAANLPIFEGRKLGSNLEITLVDSNETTPLQFSRDSKKPIHSMYKMPNRPEHSNKNNEENGEYVRPSTSTTKKRYRADIETNQVPPAKTSKRLMNTSSRTVAEAASNPKYFQQGVQYPAYLSQFYNGNKPINSYLPMVDPMLYSAALQGFFPQTQSSLLQFTPQEQLKFYSDLMAQQSRATFPFGMPPNNEHPHKK